jgi:PAT family beta-lactamase induction signal transducer AmpG
VRDTATPSLPQVLGQRKMLVLLLLGLSSGLPLYLTKSTLQAWATTAGVDLGTIGLASLLGLPYSVKFLWAPLLDSTRLPFLGRRRGWIVTLQLLVAVSVMAMSLHEPRRALLLLGANAFLIALFSATQDIVVDAYRIDVLADRELGLGVSLHVMGYRVGMLLTGGLALVLAERMSWQQVYLVCGLLALLPIGATLAAREPRVIVPPSSFRTVLVEPFADFVGRVGGVRLGLVLGFIVLFKLADSLLLNMALPFLLSVGYTKAQVGILQGALGIGSTVAGAFVGGLAMTRLGLNRALWIFGILQMASNAAYYALAVLPRDVRWLTAAVVVENVCTGLVTAAFTGFLMAMCSREYSATQFALLTSLMAFSRDILVAPSGKIAEALGWPGYFLFTVAAGLPGLILLPWFAPWGRDVPVGAAVHAGEVEEDARREAMAGG